MTLQTQSFMTDIALIAVDWGSSAFRAYGLDAAGNILTRHASAGGILSVDNRDFEGALQREIGGWLSPTIPLIASGMITSRQGWVETPYVPCPADAAAIAALAVPHQRKDGGSLLFTPGATMADGIQDVMRGEEIQILGGVDMAGEALCLLPGTHSKWARVSGGAIRAFATFLTGDVFAALIGHTILGRMAEGRAHAPAAFARGVEDGAASAKGGALLHDIFAARTAVLAGKLEMADVASFLSGFLIGAEIAGAWRLLDLPKGANPVILANETLTGHYCAALATLSKAGTPGPSDCAARGLFSVAKARGLV